MYNIGNNLILIKNVSPSKYSYGTKYTLNNNYKILFIKGEIYYLENDDTKNILYSSDLTIEDKDKKLKRESSIWFEYDIDNYFIDIKEQRRNKIKEIMNSNG